MDFYLGCPHESRSQLSSTLISSTGQTRLATSPSCGLEQPVLVYKVYAILLNLEQALLVDVTSSTWLALMSTMWLLGTKTTLSEHSASPCLSLPGAAFGWKEEREENAVGSNSTQSFANWHQEWVTTRGFSYQIFKSLLDKKQPKEKNIFIFREISDNSKSDASKDGNTPLLKGQLKGKFHLPCLKAIQTKAQKIKIFSPKSHRLGNQHPNRNPISHSLPHPSLFHMSLFTLSL